MIGSFTYHQAAPGLILFTCWNAAHDGCGCHSVTPDKFSANIEALERMGYVNRTARREYLDLRRREWRTAQPAPIRGIP